MLSFVKKNKTKVLTKKFLLCYYIRVKRKQKVITLKQKEVFIMTTETQIPEYLQNEYVIQEGEHLTCLDSLLAWYWTNYSFLKENLDCSESVFIEKVKNCKTMKEMKKLVNQYV